MFTGIIEEIGQMIAIHQGASSYELVIGAKTVLEDVKLGDSIAVNGICLTVTSFTSKQFSVDVMPETIKSTNLKKLSRGSHVNLERAMMAKGRFGGHFVSGHVDCVGEITGIHPKNNAVYYSIKVSPNWMKYIMTKGSITVDGTSLTVFQTTEDTFLLSLIPHTRQKTVLGQKEIGDTVNIECDMLAKYMDQLLSYKTVDQRESQLTYDKLKDNGFI